MNSSTTCTRCSRAAGLTLIEVVSAIAILGTLLVGIVLARARHTHQYARAQSTQAAVEAADELLSGWWLDNRRVPVGESGVFEDHPSLSWRTFEVAKPHVAKLEARVVRLQVRRAPPDAVSESHTEVLFGVDLVMRLPEPDEPPLQRLRGEPAP
ncbi:MAG: hypothetical protein KGY81_10275 [Phycisphaerae bacterium]|nr:hypothetical protein [Phycisphaerae bacterium]